MTRDIDKIKKDLKIGIIGSGIAGLSVGLALHNAGFTEITIYERDDCFNRRRQGYGLTMLQGNRALKRLGVFDQVKHIDTPSRSHYIFDCTGNIVGFFGTKFWPTPPLSSAVQEKSTKYNLHISRQNLRKILYDEVATKVPSMVRWGTKLESIIHHDNGSWSLTFSDGQVTNEELVIGCDGINSFVRREVWLDENPLKYLGILLVLGITKTDHYLSQERVFQTVDGNTRLFAMPFFGDEDSSDENIMWQLSFPLEEFEAHQLALDLPQLKDRVLQKCSTWHDPIPSIITSTNLSLLMGIPAYDRDPVPVNHTKHPKTLVLLGDAAHPMSPFKGQGANQALLDGVNFADTLSRSKDLPSAISSFETEMWNRVRKKVLESRDRAETFHRPDILDGEFFRYRGISQEFLQRLKSQGINSSRGEEIDELIINEMQDLYGNTSSHQPA